MVVRLPYGGTGVSRPKKRVFLSFLAEDKDHVSGLRLLAAHPTYELDFYDESVKVPIDSHNADYVKQQLRDKIARSSVTVCLISERTYTSSWVAWELAESERAGNAIIAMAIKGVTQAILPTLIRERKLPFWPWDTSNLSALIATA